MSVASFTVPGMASRTNVSAGVTLARLDGTARNLLGRKIPRDQALNELRKVGATPEQIRHAAATARSFFADKHPLQAQQGRDVADLLEGLL